ncbi:hypothetical protein [Bradyrhizobium japonicum]|uniref:hypothetical protein n=1 Tax=Bradyrhizobium japonicum TaxID=375 RepID=UPI002714D416|nr:hypothetical protein [Bradyrhizobium japonicum]WLB24018.1 hypothetical protein QIH95_49625 [Bradyrhizobium japonicum]
MIARTSRATSSKAVSLRGSFRDAPFQVGSEVFQILLRSALVGDVAHDPDKAKPVDFNAFFEAASETVQVPAIEDSIAASTSPVSPLRQPADRAKRRRERRERRREARERARANAS